MMQPSKSFSTPLGGISFATSYAIARRFFHPSRRRLRARVPRSNRLRGQESGSHGSDRPTSEWNAESHSISNEFSESRSHAKRFSAADVHTTPHSFAAPFL